MKFFIVDDDRVVISFVTHKLQAEGHEVESTSDSAGAVEAVLAHQPDCVLLDIMMPDVDGLTILKELREKPQLRNTAIVMFSSKPYEYDRRRAMELGADAFVNKLTDNDGLVERLTGIVSRSMNVTFWGTRGTMPVPGEFSLHYGGNTSCVSIDFPSSLMFIFDAGTGIKALANELVAKRRLPMRAKIFISHPHWDHINALPFFVPLYTQGSSFEILGTSHEGRSMKELLSAQMDGVYFPVTVKEFAADVEYRDISEGEYDFDGITVKTMLLNHPGHCLGYRVDYGGKSVCYITDNELYPESTPYHNARYREQLIEFVHGTEMLIMDATYTDEQYPDKVHWGHSAVSEVVDLAHEAEAKNLYLFHHDPDQTDDDINAKLNSARARLETLDSKTVVHAPAEKQVISV